MNIEERIDRLEDRIERVLMVCWRLEERLDEIADKKLVDKPMRVNEAAEYYKVNAQTVYRWIKEGRIPTHKHGRTYLIYPSEVRDSNIFTKNMQE